MMTGEPLALRIEEHGFTALFAGDDPVHIEPQDRAGWDNLRTALHGRRRLALHVPVAARLDLALPAGPQRGRAARVMLAAASPMPLSELAWTRPIPTEEGGAKVTLVRRAWLDPRVEAVEHALGIVPHVIVEPDGAPLLYRSPRERRRLTITTATMILSAVIAATALASLQDGQPSAADIPAAAIDPLPAGDAVAATIAALAAAVPADAAVLAIAADGTGGASIEVSTANPNMLGVAIASTRTLTGLRETAQVPDPAGGWRVTYQARLPERRAGARTVPLMAAISRNAASATARQRLAVDASRNGVRLTLGGDTATGAAPLRFAYTMAGSQDAVLALADAIESGSPPTRLRDWHLRPAGGGVTLTGTLSVPWRRTP